MVQLNQHQQNHHFLVLNLPQLRRPRVVLRQALADLVQRQQEQVVVYLVVEARRLQQVRVYLALVNQRQQAQAVYLAARRHQLQIKVFLALDNRQERREPRQMQIRRLALVVVARVQMRQVRYLVGLRVVNHLCLLQNHLEVRLVVLAEQTQVSILTLSLEREKIFVFTD